MKELVGLLKRFILNKLTFHLLELHQGVIKFNRLPVELRNSKKEIINIKNNDQKCFLWCHMRYNNPVKIHTERITKQDKELINTLDYEKKGFSVSKKDFNKIEVKNKICINVCCYENKLIYPVHISDQKFKNSIDLLIISDKIKSHCVYIKDFNNFLFSKTKNKKYFCKYCLQSFSSERILLEHKKIVLSTKW